MGEGDYQHPMSWNRWNYVNSNPINFTDPTGRCLDIDGDAECDFPETAIGELSSEPKRSIDVEVPPWVDICLQCGDCPEGDQSITPEEILQAFDSVTTHLENAAQSYLVIQAQLDDRWLEDDGKLRDYVLIALIMMEFSHYGRWQAVYLESKEALANQYHAMNDNAGHAVPVESYPGGCQGSCGSIAEQVKWASEIQMLRDFNIHQYDGIMSGRWLANLSEAHQIQSIGFVWGQNLSWTWGNWVVGSPMDDYLQERGSIDWWAGPGRPWQEIDEYQKFWVLSPAQDYACKHRSGGSCRGW